MVLGSRWPHAGEGCFCWSPGSVELSVKTIAREYTRGLRGCQHAIRLASTDHSAGTFSLSGSRPKRLSARSRAQRAVDCGVGWLRLQASEGLTTRGRTFIQPQRGLEGMPARRNTRSQGPGMRHSNEGPVAADCGCPEIPRQSGRRQWVTGGRAPGITRGDRGRVWQRPLVVSGRLLRCWYPRRDSNP